MEEGEKTHETNTLKQWTR